MATYSRFEELGVWQAARRFCKAVSLKTRGEQFSREFDLKRQILRSAGSTMDNIAEGFEREGNMEFIQFLSIAKGSNGEARSQLYRAFDFECINEEELNELKILKEELSKRLSGFITYLKRSSHTGKKFDRQPISNRTDFKS